MPDPSQQHKHTISLDDAAKKMAHEEIESYQKQRDPLKEALAQVEQHYRSLPKRRK